MVNITVAPSLYFGCTECIQKYTLLYFTLIYFTLLDNFVTSFLIGYPV